MKASLVWAALLSGFVAASCGRDPLLPTPSSLGGAGGGAGAGGGPGGDSGVGGSRGSGGSGGRDGAVPDVPRDLPVIDVLPGMFFVRLLPEAGLTLPVGKSARLRAVVQIGADWRDLGSDPLLAWQSDNVRIAEVAALSGRVTGLAPGVTTIRASHPLFGTAQAPVTVLGGGGALVQVLVQPSPLTLTVGGKGSLGAQAIYEDGRTADVTGAAIWVSGDQRIARVQNSVPPLGEVSAVLSGETVVSAEFAGLVGTAVVRVAGAGVATLSVAPASATQTVGSVFRFQAVLRQPSGTASDVTTLATWANTTGTGATSLGQGQFRCTAAGAVTVRATHMGQSATATLQCNAAGATVKELRISPPANSPLPVKARIRLTLTAFLADGTPMEVTSAAQIRWTSSNPAVATIDGSATLTGVAAGMATITASFAGLTTSETYTFFAP